MARAIPTNLITGFLGSGKTTAILHLLANKLGDETWGVLVNEFGEIGIDGAMMAGKGAVVREVPGGCMCCVAGLPIQIGLNMLIARSKPDRILIEPTGLGHPEQILNILVGEYYDDILDLRKESDIPIFTFFVQKLILINVLYCEIRKSLALDETLLILLRNRWLPLSCFFFGNKVLHQFIINEKANATLFIYY